MTVLERHRQQRAPILAGLVDDRGEPPLLLLRLEQALNLLEPSVAAGGVQGGLRSHGRKKGRKKEGGKGGEEIRGGGGEGG